MTAREQSKVRRLQNERMRVARPFHNWHWGTRDRPAVHGRPTTADRKAWRKLDRAQRRVDRLSRRIAALEGKPFVQRPLVDTPEERRP